MATYPNDAKTTITAFPVTSTIIYSTTGAARTVFNLSATVDHRGEVAAFIDGILQQTDQYAVSNGGATITFDTPPNASNLTLQTVSVPPKLKQTRSSFESQVVEYSNTSPTIINSNAYLINADTISFALPATASISSTDAMQVYLSGVYQNPSAYVYPSTTLGFNGIDIADNTATKLLLNFTNNLTDESDSGHTITAVGSGGSFSGSGTDYVRSFGGSDYLQTPSNIDFDITDKSFTYDLFLKPDTGTTMAANQSLLSRHFDANNNYNLRLVGANSNVGFVMSIGGNITEIYGGNANGGSNYHVAVSYDLAASNLRLYVNNVSVAHTNFASIAPTTGNLAIGANSNTASVGELYNGTIDFVRFAHAPRYKTETIEPVTDTSPSVITVQSGAPLAAISSDDSLSIRIFDSAVETQDRFTSMADRRPDTGIGSSRGFDVVTFASQAGYEKRRLKSRRSKRNYDLTYTAITGVEKTAIENFYIARSGEFESFSFDLSHINETGIITTRFAGPLEIDQTYSTGSRLIDNYYTVSFKLQEVFD